MPELPVTTKDGLPSASNRASYLRGVVSIILTILVVYIIIYSMSRTAKLFPNGRSQAVRLPAEFRFEGSEVYVRRDSATGDVILSRRPESWQDFFAFIDTIEVPGDFLEDRQDAPPQKRKLF